MSDQEYELPQIPDGWEWRTLQELAHADKHSLTDGPFGSKLKSAHYCDAGVRVIRLGNIGVGEFKDKVEAYISDEHYANLTKHEAFEGDIIIAALAEPVGRACRVPPEIGRAIVKADCIRFKPSNEIDPSFATYWLNSPPGLASAEFRAHGIGRLRINLGEMRALPVPVPPLETQHRIVAALDAIQERTRAARAALEAVPPLVEKFRQSVLASAFRGDLTADWRAQNPDVEPASELLKRIRVERRERWIADYAEKHRARAEKRAAKAGKTWSDKDDAKKRAEGLKKGAEKYEAPAPVDPVAEELPELPDTWCWARLGELTTSITSGSRGWSKFYGRGTGTFVMAQNIKPGRLDWSRRQTVDAPDDAEARRTLVERGDTLITIVGANTGDAALVDATLVEHYVCQSVALLRPGLNELSTWLCAGLQPGTPGGRNISNAIYGQGRPHLSFADLEMIPIPLCPARETSIALERFERAARDISHSHLAIQQINQLDQLERSALAKAFRGELVQ